MPLSPLVPSMIIAHKSPKKKTKINKKKEKVKSQETKKREKKKTQNVVLDPVHNFYIIYHWFTQVYRFHLSHVMMT